MKARMILEIYASSAGYCVKNSSFHQQHRLNGFGWHAIPIEPQHQGDLRNTVFIGEDGKIYLSHEVMRLFCSHAHYLPGSIKIGSRSFFELRNREVLEAIVNGCELAREDKRSHEVCSRNNSLLRLFLMMEKVDEIIPQGAFS